MTTKQLKDFTSKLNQASKEHGKLYTFLALTTKADRIINDIAVINNLHGCCDYVLQINDKHELHDLIKVGGYINSYVLKKIEGLLEEANQPTEEAR